MSFQNINGAVIQWQNYTSTTTNNQYFNFNQPFPDNNVAVITNRTTPKKGDILPVVETTPSNFTINRGSNIELNLYLRSIGLVRLMAISIFFG